MNQHVERDSGDWKRQRLLGIVRAGWIPQRRYCNWDLPLTYAAKADGMSQREPERSGGRAISHEGHRGVAGREGLSMV